MEFEVATPKKFNECLTKNKKLEFLTVYPESALQDWTLLLAKPEGAGFAITPDGELVNILNNTSIKGLGAVMVGCALVLGVHKVFCFDGYLREYCESFGFRVYKRAPWNSKCAPKNWDYKKYGKPDVVWLSIKRD